MRTAILGATMLTTLAMEGCLGLDDLPPVNSEVCNADPSAERIQITTAQEAKNTCNDSFSPPDFQCKKDGSSDLSTFSCDQVKDGLILQDNTCTVDRSVVCADQN